LQAIDKGIMQMNTGTDEMPVDLGVLEEQVNNVQKDVGEIKGALSQIASAITKLAVLEDRHQNTLARVDKLETRLQANVDKTSELEKAQIKAFAMAEGASRAIKIVWMVIGAAVVAAIGKYAVVSFVH
jgi:chromosome segregation ATPase